MMTVTKPGILLGLVLWSYFQHLVDSTGRRSGENTYPTGFHVSNAGLELTMQVTSEGIELLVLLPPPPTIIGMCQ